MRLILIFHLEVGSHICRSSTSGDHAHQDIYHVYYSIPVNDLGYMWYPLVPLTGPIVYMRDKFGNM